MRHRASVPEITRGSHLRAQAMTNAGERWHVVDDERREVRLGVERHRLASDLECL